MQFSVTVHGNNANELATGLRAHLALLETTPKTTKKTTKAEEETFGGTDMGEVEDTTPATDETEAETVTADQVRTACATYVKAAIKKGSSAEDARAKIRNLFKKKFGVTTVDQIDEADLGEALALVS